MKFSRIAKGTRQRKVVSFPLMGGGEATCALVPLLEHDDIEILSQARAFALKKGAEAKEGDPVYERALWVHTLVRACVDVDSPLEAAEPFFDGGVEQIIHPTDGLDNDRIALLFELQRAWQTECSPSPRALSGEEYISLVLRIAEGGEQALDPFDAMPLAMRRAFVRSLAVQLATSLQLNALFTPSTEGSSTSSETSSGTSGSSTQH